MTLAWGKSVCRWIFSFITGRAQVVRVGDLNSISLTLSTGMLQGCALSPLLYLFTHNCDAKYSFNIIIKFTDETTIMSLIIDNGDMIYREMVKALAKWCMDNNLSLNISKTKEMVMNSMTWQGGGLRTSPGPFTRKFFRGSTS